MKPLLYRLDRVPVNPVTGRARVKRECDCGGEPKVCERHLRGRIRSAIACIARLPGNEEAVKLIASLGACCHMDEDGRVTPCEHGRRVCLTCARVEVLAAIEDYRHSRVPCKGLLVPVETRDRIRDKQAEYVRSHREQGLCRFCPRKVHRGGRCRRHYRYQRKWAAAHFM